MTSLADAQRIRELEARIGVLEDELATFAALFTGLFSRIEALEGGVEPAPEIVPATPPAAQPPPRPKRVSAYQRWQERQNQEKEVVTDAA